MAEMGFGTRLAPIHTITVWQYSFFVKVGGNVSRDAAAAILKLSCNQATDP